MKTRVGQRRRCDGGGPDATGAPAGSQRTTATRGASGREEGKGGTGSGTSPTGDGRTPPAAGGTGRLAARSVCQLLAQIARPRCPFRDVFLPFVPLQGQPHLGVSQGVPWSVQDM